MLLTPNYKLKKPEGTDVVDIDDINENADIIDAKLKELNDNKAPKNLATTSANGLMSNTDKTKLDGIATGANKYTHPANHPATIITEDATHRFVTDTEKSTWNGKASTAVVTTSANGLMSKTDKAKLDGVANGANAYVHPNNHPATIITEDVTHRFVTDTEKNTWNGKAGTSVATASANGLMSKTDKSKLDGIAAGANNYVHPTKHPASIITQDANNRFVTDSEKSKWNGLFNTTKSNLALAGSLVAATGYTNAIHLSKDGIVTINFGVRYHIENSNGLTTGQTLFTLPTNLRPKQGVIIPALAVRVGGLSNAIGYLYIRETGVVTFALVGDLTAYSQVCGCVTFSVN